MDFWSAILTLAVIEIMNLLMHILLPEGTLRKYASFVMGILVVYTLLGPLVHGVRILDEQISGLDMKSVVARYERIEWRDYLVWYLGQSGDGQE
jgi:hypothetical protein